MAKAKVFYYKDKSGRGFKGNVSPEHLKSLGNIENYDGDDLQEWVENAEEGDEWESASALITCIE